jgi:hypothetical protein
MNCRYRVHLLFLLLLIPDRVQGSEVSTKFNFRTQILPILTKAGCNAGACHGASTGQDGFHLSLLGYDPEEDFWSITREFSGRRLDLDAPHESLFLRKPTRQIEHDGGRKIRRDSQEYQTLLRWIEAGAPYGAPQLRVVSIEVSPAERLFANTNEQVQLKVTASFSDGSHCDVSTLALYSSNDDGMAEVSPTGTVTTRRRGLTSIMVRFCGQVAAARIAVPLNDTIVTQSDFSPVNFIDHDILAELKRLRIPPSAKSEDAEFLRRIYLDLTGRLPDINTARRFLSQTGSDGKRRELIDNLLQSSDFVDFWTLRFSDLLLISGKGRPEQSARVYHGWLREQIASSKAWDEIARALLTANGELSQNGPPNFFNLASDPRDLAEHVSSIFLSTQIACARCHAHPSDRWNQEDYYQFAAYFAKVSRDGNSVADVSSRAELQFPKTKRPVLPRALGALGEPSESSDRRGRLADWLASPANPFFARAIVNRVWKHLLGRGLVEPVDDLRPTNPPTHPKLLEDLSEHFIRNNFDFRTLIKTIVSSETYQLSSQTLAANRMDDCFYSHSHLKPLSAQVFLDSIADVTGVAASFTGYPQGTRAVQLADSQTESYSLDVLGRCARARRCEPVAMGGGLAQALHLINGSAIGDKLSGPLLDLLQSSAISLREAIEEIYLRALTRFPSPAEAAFWEKTLSARTPDLLQDFVWTILNCREFAFNH